jgi:hypothetical protein
LIVAAEQWRTQSFQIVVYTQLSQFQFLETLSGSVSFIYMSRMGGSALPGWLLPLYSTVKHDRTRLDRVGPHNIEQ